MHNVWPGFGLLIILIAIVLQLVAGNRDRNRIRRYIEEGGGRVIKTSWSPFHPGCFSESRDPIYRVRYFDKDDVEHEAYCQTSWWVGVYFTDDRIVRSAKD